MVTFPLLLRGALSSKRLMGMCRWIGSHSVDCTDDNGVAFSGIFTVTSRQRSINQKISTVGTKVDTLF